MSTEPSSHAPDIFATTRWSVVLAAGGTSDTRARAALEELGKTYWFPLYAYIRRRGYPKADAEDLTQSFFTTLIGSNSLDGLSAQHGRFRAFLLASLKHFLANEWDKSQRLKRGGGATHLALDWQTADTKFQLAAGTQLSPDQVFDREWAVALLAKVLIGLQQQCEAEGRGKQFTELKAFLTLDKSATNPRQAAVNLGMEEGAVRVAIHRLRKLYRARLRDEITQTLSDPAQADEELRALFGAFSG